MGKKGRKFLRAHAKRARRIIEVGVWKGRSTAVLARATSGTVWAVDHWQGTPSDPDQHALYSDDADESGDAVYAEFCANLAAYIEAGKVVPVRADSVEAAGMLLGWYGPVFDLVFIDGDHSYEGCRRDIEAYRKLIAPGGILAGHDYHWPGVQQAVDELLTDVVLGPKSLWHTTM
jgi:predicted O-methyltransferase YrrM